MQGINLISPSVVRALVASAALFTGVSTSIVQATTPKTQGQYEEVAFTLPRFLSGGSGSNSNISLPRPLDKQEAERIRHIFDLQKQGDFTTAQSETIQLSDNSLLGDILAERYLNQNYQPTIGQLKLWLKNFKYYADAPLIIQRLNNISPKINPKPISHALPILRKKITEIHFQPHEESDPITSAFKRNPLLDHTISARTALGINGAKSALALIQKTPGMTTLYAAQLQAEIAQQLFTMGETDQAFDIAQKAFSLSQGQIGLAGYIAGLASWKNQQNDLAFYLFSKASRAEVIAPNIRTGCFFWAARSRLNDHDIQGYQAWLRRAATSPHTFYGILANYTLEHLHDNNKIHRVSANIVPQQTITNDQPHLNSVDINAVEDTILGTRFFALLQVNQRDRAEIVLRQLWLQNTDNLALAKSIQLVAQAADFTELSQQLKTLLKQDDTELFGNSNLPLPKLKPRHGYKINPALVYALTRLESNFNSKAISHNGAMGLMQIMPVTAKYITKDQDNITLTHADELQNGALNLEIGQLYLIHLAELYKKKNIETLPKGGSLIHMLASYNAGPTTASKWLDTTSNNEDPLLFMETIPIKETKNYVHKAFTYLWIYSKEMDLPSPSLKALSHNEWPSFAYEEQINHNKPVLLH